MSTDRKLPATVRRASYLFVCLRDGAVVDFDALVRGEILYQTEAQLEIVDPRTGEFRPISGHDLEILPAIPADAAVSVADLLADAGIDESAIRRLIKAGALVDPDDPQWLAQTPIAWHPVAKIFHSSCLYGGVSDSSEPGSNRILDLERLRSRSEVDVSKHVETHGAAPPPRLRYGSESGKSEQRNTERVRLPLDEPPDDAFFETLAKRRTWRHFENRAIGRGKLSTLLRWTFGVHGTVRLGDQHIVALKTSPSGGAMHPIEAFPIVVSVDDIEPGIYHYDSFGHMLEPLHHAPRDELSELAVQVASGQDFAGEAAVLILLVARLARNFWKYPNSARTYSVIHQDAGHLSQTFYLASTRLGLGSFYTAAVNGWVTKEFLGLDNSVDAPMGLCGCGLPLEEKADWLGAEEYIPRHSTLEVPQEVRRSPLQELGSGTSARGSEHLSSPAHLGKLRLSQPPDKE